LRRRNILFNDFHGQTTTAIPSPLIKRTGSIADEKLLSIAEGIETFVPLSNGRYESQRTSD
jgi:hypothetical protein